MQGFLEGFYLGHYKGSGFRLWSLGSRGFDTAEGSDGFGDVVCLKDLGLSN